MADVTSRLRLVVDSTGVDKAGRKLKDLRKGARDADDAAARLRSTFAGLGAVLGAAFSTQAIFGAVAAFDEAARASAKVEQAIRSTGGAAGFTASELKRVAAGLQAVTLTDADKFLNEATAQLLTFTNIAGDEFLRTQKVALDLATVLDGDLKSASIQLGKALNDPVANLSALSRSGIQFAASQKELIKNLAETGRLAEAQRVILDEIERQYGGQAEAAARVGSGVLTQLKNVVGDIQELFGEKLVNLINGPAAALRDFLSVAENQESVVTAIQAIAAAMGILAAPALVSGIAALGGVFAALVSPIGLAAAAVAGLIIFRDDIAEWAFGVRDAGAVVKASMEAMRPAFVAAFNAIRDFVSAAIPILSQFAQVVIDVMRAAAEAVGGYVATINDAIGRIRIEAKTRELEGLVDKQKELTQRLKNNAAEAIQDSAVTLGTQQIKSELTAVSEQIAKTSDELNKLLNPQSPVESVRNVFSDIAERAKEIANAKLAEPIEEADRAGKKLVKTTEALTKEQKKAIEALAQYKQDLVDQQTLIDAALLGEREERIAREVLNIRRQIKDITVEDARALAEQNVELEIQLELIREQRRIVEEPFRNLADNLTDAIINGGRAGVGGLKKIFGSFLNDLKRAFLYQVFNPLIQSLSASLGGLFGVGIFTPGINGANPANAVASGSLLAAARTNGATIGGLGLPQAALGFGGLSLGGAGSIFGLASLIGPGNLGRLGAGIGNFLGLSGNLTGGLSKALAGAGTFGGALGGIGGSILSGALFGKSKGQSIGSTIGGLGGSFFGPIGSAIGSFLGGALGSLFSGKPSDSAAGGGVNFGSFGVENLFAKGTANVQARDELLQATSELARQLSQLTGATLAGSGISVQVGSRNGTRIISAAGGDVTTPVGNAQAAVDEIVRQLAASLRGGEAGLVNLTKALANAKVDVDSIIGVLTSFSEILESGRVPVSKYGEAIKQLDATLAQVTNATQIRAQAIGILRGQFEKDVSEAIEAIKTPAVAGFRELARNLASTLNDAKALGVDLGPNSKVLELVGLQIDEFFRQAASNGEDLVALTSQLANFGEILKSLGIDANIAAAALERAKITQKEAFDKQILGDIGNFLNGPLDQLEKLLEAQKTRLEQAEALGADLSQVERLSALELRQFFQGLSDSALQEVQDFLGLFNEAADSVARQLDLSRQDLRAKADQFGQFAQDFANLATDFRERFIAASPRESIDILRGRASELLGQIGQGNESAAQALPQVLNQLVDNARQSFGNTKAFQDVLEFALGALSQAEDSALGVQTEAERQIAALDESNDLLSEIRDILQSTQAFNALFNSYSSVGVASAGELLALIQSGAGLTPNAANDNAAVLSVTGLVAQSVQPIITPLVASIDNFTQNLAQMPYLQRLQIDATDRVRMAVEDQTQRLEDKLDRLEVLSKQQLAELEAA